MARRSQSSFQGVFLAAFGLATLAGLTLLSASWRPGYSGLLPLPPLPVAGREFLSTYNQGGTPDSADLYLYTTGILGFRERISRADLFLQGTSHVALGLSARDLARKLSEEKGRPVRVYNTAISGTEMPAQLAILRNNGIRDKASIVDLFFLAAIPYHHVSDLTALYYVFKIRAHFYYDYFLDPWLPQFLTKPASQSGLPLPTRIRFLHQTECRDLETGDVVWDWTPRGRRYPVPTEPQFLLVRDEVPYWKNPNFAVMESVNTEAFRELGMRVAYTLIPYSSYHRATLPAEAKPFIPIADEGLYFFDITHLSGDGRKLATERLYQGLGSLHLVP